jgi:DNA-binding response OmpR family regulator
MSLESPVEGKELSRFGHVHAGLICDDLDILSPQSGKPMALLCLIIDDNARVASQRRGELARIGMRTYVVPSFVRSIEALESWQFDAIVLNASALGPRCVAFLKHLRTHRGAPVLVLLDQYDERLQIAMLESGATDVMQASASSELIALKLLRLLAVRTESTGIGSILPPHFGSLAIDERSGVVSVDGATLDLTPYQFQLVALLASKSGEVVTRQEVIQILMGTSDIRVVDVQISRIRKKFKDMNVSDVVLRTIRGRGYSLTMNSVRTERSDTPIQAVWAG